MDTGDPKLEFDLEGGSRLHTAHEWWWELGRWVGVSRPREGGGVLRPWEATLSVSGSGCSFQSAAAPASVQVSV